MAERGGPSTQKLSSKEQRDRDAASYVAEMKRAMRTEDRQSAQDLLRTQLRTVSDELTDITNSYIYKAWSDVKNKYPDNKKAMEQTADDLESYLEILETKLIKIEKNLSQTNPDEARIAVAKQTIKKIHDEILPVLYPDHEKSSKDDTA